MAIVTREELDAVYQKIEEIEARAEARTEAMLDRLIEQRKAQLLLSDDSEKATP